MTMMTQDVASALLDIADHAHRLGEGVAGLIIINGAMSREEGDGPPTLETAALNFMASHMSEEVQAIKRLVDSVRNWPPNKGRLATLGRIAGDEAGPGAA